MNDTDNSAHTEANLLPVLEKFDVKGPLSVGEAVAGAINDTYFIQAPGENRKYVLQKLHEIFSYDLLYDFEAVSNHLNKKGINSQRLNYTKDGLPGLDTGKSIWRLMNFIPGRSITNVTVKTAASAGKLLGEFHTALLDFEYEFKFKLNGYHDIEHNMRYLENTVSENRNSEKMKHLESLCDTVFDEYDKTGNPLSKLPARVVHGDPKKSNFIFDHNEDIAVSLIDLDTVSWNKSVTDIGDAVRSWCHNNEGEDSLFSTDVFKALISGYLSTADFLTNDEKSAIIDGIKLVTLELSARYLSDAFKEKYFKLDASKYQSLYEQNRFKAWNLIKFYAEIEKNIDLLQDIIDRCSIKS